MIATNPIKTLFIALLFTMYAGASVNLELLLAERNGNPKTEPSARSAQQADFPCAGHHCGCANAEDCRNHCCCFPKSHQLASDKHIAYTCVTACGLPDMPSTFTPRSLRSHVSSPRFQLIALPPQANEPGGIHLSPHPGFAPVPGKIPRSGVVVQSHLTVINNV